MGKEPLDAAPKARGATRGRAGEEEEDRPETSRLFRFSAEGWDDFFSWHSTLRKACGEAGFIVATVQVWATRPRRSLPEETQSRESKGDG